MHKREASSNGDLLSSQAAEVNERMVSNAGAGLKTFQTKLQAVLSSKALKDVFLKAAKRQFCEESIRFYLAIVEWEKIPPTNL